MARKRSKSGSADAGIVPIADLADGVEMAVGTDIEEAINRTNERYALVLTGDKVSILHETTTPEGHSDVRFLSVEAFRAWFANWKVPIGDRRVLVSELWMASPWRRQYEGVTFAPEGAPEQFYNMWRGFAVQPVPGDCSLFTEHIMDNVCDGDPYRYDYVMGWFAHLVQRPHEKLGTSLVLRGRQGTGKTKVGEVIGSLIEPYYAAVADPRYITGQFNSHLTTCLLLQADEGFWAGDRQAEGKLKDLVTGRYQFIEMKGKEPFRVRNLMRLMVTSNHDWTVPAGLEERRFAVFDVGDDRMQDNAYFAAIDHQVENGGREALMHHLMNIDLSAVDLSRVPDTGALVEQKIASMNPIEAWWLDRLAAGAPLSRLDRWPDCVATRDLMADYVAHADRTGINRKSTETQFGIAIQQLVPGIARKRETVKEFDAAGNVTGGRQQRVYRLPSLELCRSFYARKLNGHAPWEREIE